MPTSRPLPVLCPERARHMPRSFAWIDHRLRSTGILQDMTDDDIGLYLFLTLASDKQGLSCWRLDRVEREIPCLSMTWLTNPGTAVPSMVAINCSRYPRRRLNRRAAESPFPSATCCLRSAAWAAEILLF